MGNNKVSEKAIWEGSISPDNNTPSIASQMQTQPQMMFCYKCNNVIPGNSTFCPYCQIKLFVECPKCGAKYSSQYPACNNCGTNREEFLQMQRREAERKAAIERENRRRQETEERKRKEAEEEKERQERLKRYEREASERQQKEAYIKENAEIIKTKEYKTVYSLLSEAIADYEKRSFNMGCLLGPLFTIIIMATLFFIHPILGFISIIVLPFVSDSIIKELNLKKYRKYLQKYISSSNNYDNKMMALDLIDTVSYQGKERLSDCCIIAYREKHNRPINYKWHNLRRD